MPTLTLADLQDRVYSRVDHNDNLYPPSEVTAAVNESIRVLNLMTGWLQATIPLPYVSQKNRFWYRVPAGILIPTRVLFEGRVLQRRSLSAIGMQDNSWLTKNTTFSGLPVTYWMPYGWDRFAIYPADGYGGAQMQVTGIQEPVPLVNPSDTINFHPSILAAFDLYATHVLQLKESPKTFAAGSTDYQAFQRMMKDITIWEGYKGPRYFVENLQQVS